MSTTSSGSGQQAQGEGQSLIRLPDGTLRTASDLLVNVVERYLREQHAVVPLYDLTNVGPHDDVEAVDLLALNALNAFIGRPPMTPMTAMWASRATIPPLVTLVSKEGVEHLSEGDLPLEAAKLEKVIRAVEVVKGFGSTRTAKLIHRLRPNLMPIWDIEVGKWYNGYYQLPWKDWLLRVYQDVREPDTLQGLKWIQGQLPDSLSLLRVWDILLWKLKWRATRP